MFGPPSNLLRAGYADKTIFRHVSQVDAAEVEEATKAVWVAAGLTHSSDRLPQMLASKMHASWQVEDESRAFKEFDLLRGPCGVIWCLNYLFPLALPGSALCLFLLNSHCPDSMAGVVVEVDRSFVQALAHHYICRRPSHEAGQVQRGSGNSGQQ